MSPDKLVYMANQIGKFFASQGPQQAVAGTADHIKKFWDPRMRATILAHLKEGGAGTRSIRARSRRTPRGEQAERRGGQRPRPIEYLDVPFGR